MATTQARGSQIASRVEGVGDEAMQKSTGTPENTHGFNNPFGGSGSTERPTSADDENAIEKQHSNESDLGDVAGSPPQGLSPQPQTRDRSASREWDASKVPPSQFQKRKGSIYATASSRDSHLHRKDRDESYFAKLKEKGWH